jgi:putative aldouronate transport system substrate-binding protein
MIGEITLNKATIRMKLLIGTIILMVGLAGCTSNDKPGVTPSAAGNEPAPIVEPPGSFPITKEKTTLKVMVKASASVEDFTTNEFTKWYEDKTNVHIEWEIVPEKSAQEKLSLMLASKDYPDVIMDMGVSSAQQMMFGSEGVFLPLNKLIDKYGVETKKMFDAIPQVKDSITAPDGNIYALPQVAECSHCVLNQKMWINQTWLDKLGLKMPETTDDFYKVLKAFKEQDPNGNGKADEIPLAGSIGGQNTNVEGFLMNAFIINSPYNNAVSMMVNNGKIDAAFNKPEWKEGIAYLHKLYAEGLIAPESFTQDTSQLKKLGENPDRAIVGVVPATSLGNFTNIAGKGTRWLEYTAVPPLKGPQGQRQTPYNPYDVARSGNYVITSASKHPDVAFRWADAMYNEEITMRKGYGRPDQEWRWAKPGEIGINGKPAKWFTTFDVGNLQNISWATTGPHYRTSDLRDLRALTPPSNEITLFNETKNKYEPYKQNTATIVPPLYFTSDQLGELNDLSKTINDYLKEMTARFITGDANLDKEWNTYLEKLKGMNIDRYLQIYQDTYNAKLNKK